MVLLEFHLSSRLLLNLSHKQLQKYLRHCSVFWHKWSVHDLVLVIPPPPLNKVVSNTRPCSKLGVTTLNGREEGGQCSRRPVTSSDLKHERLFFRGSVSTFLQLVVAVYFERSELLICFPEFHSLAISQRIANA